MYGDNIDQLLNTVVANNNIHPHEFVREVINDFWTCLISREASLLARKEVLTGKAKFGITGDGKEVPQVAMARAFRKGDFKAGYYRDQTFMMALGLCTVEDFFAQLYADQQNDPFSSGRQMNNHFSSSTIDQEGNWLDQRTAYNISSDISCTGGQMPRALGHALASRLFRQNKALEEMTLFNDSGEGLTVVSIGDASTSEGPFWETMNAAAVMQVPLATCVYDDGYGISVPVELQTVKGSISKALEGFYLEQDTNGILIYVVKGWDYPGLVEAFETGFEKCRVTQVPALFHIQELTQPQGHSTSGSHERYKTPDRLTWEKSQDCIEQMAQWMLDSRISTADELARLREQAGSYAREMRKRAWDKSMDGPRQLRQELINLLEQTSFPQAPEIQRVIHEAGQTSLELGAGEIFALAHRLNILCLPYKINITGLNAWMDKVRRQYDTPLHRGLLAEGSRSMEQLKPEPLQIAEGEMINGSQVLNHYFNALFAHKTEVVAFGEDVGFIGDVNQGFAGLQKVFGDSRIFDTGIRENTIVGQAIGLAMRGFRPIAEIQYLDYLPFAMSPLMDDLATVRYRSGGRQCAPAIIRTRGHRLEGIWHSGSPMALLLGSLRGMHICVPRDMTRAIGMYNMLLAGMDPGIVVECLNGYRLKEQLPANLLEYKVELGVPEVLQQGQDLTLVTYGSCVRVVQQALELLAEYPWEIELIDVQTLLPFDKYGIIGRSLEKTNKLLIVDEDIPGGASAFILQQVLEKQGGYYHLDEIPATLTAREHRPPFGSDGDYFCKPSAEEVAARIIDLLSNYKPLQ